MPTPPFLQNRLCRLTLTFIFLAAATIARSASFYTQPLPDPKAVTIAAPTGSDDTAALQTAIDRVRETTGQGIVFIAPGRYQYHQYYLHLARHSRDRIWRNPPRRRPAREHAKLRRPRT